MAQIWDIPGNPGRVATLLVIETISTIVLLMGAKADLCNIFNHIYKPKIILGRLRLPSWLGKRGYPSLFPIDTFGISLPQVYITIYTCGREMPY